MEAVNGNSSRRLRTTYLVEQDADLSAFRKRNRILIFLLLFFILSLTLLLIAYFLHNFRPHGFDTNPAPCEYSCFRRFGGHFRRPALTINSNQTFIHSLETATNGLHNFISFLSKLSNENYISAVHLIDSCSNSSMEALNQIGSALATVRADPSAEVADPIAAAEESLRACMDDGDPEGGGLESDQSEVSRVVIREKAVAVKEQVNAAARIARRQHGVVLQVVSSRYDYMVSDRRGVDIETMFGIGMVGLQLSYMFFLFCCLFRIR